MYVALLFFDSKNRLDIVNVLIILIGNISKIYYTMILRNIKSESIINFSIVVYNTFLFTAIMNYCFCIKRLLILPEGSIRERNVETLFSY